MAEGRVIVDPMVMAGLIDAEQAFAATSKNFPAMDPWTEKLSALENVSETGAGAMTVTPRPAQGNLEDACAALEKAGICIDRGVFEALVCLAASGLLSSRPRKGK